MLISADNRVILKKNKPTKRVAKLIIINITEVKAS